MKQNDPFKRLSQIGLKETTNKIQQSHGTRSFQDKRFKDVFYSWHSRSGYVRRNRHSGYIRTYQLNPCGQTASGGKTRLPVWNPIEAALIIMQHAVQYRERSWNNDRNAPKHIMALPFSNPSPITNTGCPNCPYRQPQ